MIKGYHADIDPTGDPVEQVLRQERATELAGLEPQDETDRVTKAAMQERLGLRWNDDKAGLAQRLGLKLGDRLRFDIAGSPTLPDALRARLLARRRGGDGVAAHAGMRDQQRQLSPKSAPS